MLLPVLPSLFSESFASPSLAGKVTPPKRLCVVFFGIGVALPPPDHPAHNDRWFPHSAGKDYVLNKPLRSLQGLRDQFSILSGLSHPRTREMYSHSTGAYFLTGAEPDAPSGNTVSMDQIYAGHVGDQTRYPFLTLGSEGGVGDFRLPNTLSYALDGQPIPSIGTPRDTYNELFGVPRVDAAAMRRSFGRDRSILDAVVSELNGIKSTLGGTDKQRLDQYLGAVRQLEERVERAEAWLDVARPNVPESQFVLDTDPIKDGPTSFIDSMYQLIHTAFVTDSTRTVTYMKVKEGAGGLAAKFPTAIGLPHHHAMSHGYESEGGYERWVQYDTFLTKRFAKFLNAMATTDDPIGEGSLLDNTIVLYGSGTSNTHNPRNFPLILAGGRNLGLVHGEYHQFSEDIPFSNLLLTILQQLGAPEDRFSDSTGTISKLIV